MKTYFYTDGKTNYGPFTIDELKSKDISLNTYVWTETFAEWKKAGDVAELSTVVEMLSPPIKRPQEQKSSRKLIDILLLCSLIYWLFNKLMHFIIPWLIDAFNLEYYKVYPIVNIVLTVVFIFVPVTVACSIENKVMKIIGIIISAILAIFMLTGAVSMFIQMQKYSY